MIFGSFLLIFWVVCNGSVNCGPFFGSFFVVSEDLIKCESMFKVNLIAGRNVGRFQRLI